MLNKDKNNPDNKHETGLEPELNAKYSDFEKEAMYYYDTYFKNDRIQKERYYERIQELEEQVQGTYLQNWNRMPEGYPGFQTNYLHNIKELKSSAITLDSPQVEFKATKAGDVSVVNKVNKVIKQYWKKSGLKYAIKDCLTTSRYLPVGITVLDYGNFNTASMNGEVQNFYNKKGIISQTVHPHRFFWDVRSFSIEGCRHATVAYRSTIEKVEQDLQNLDGKDKKDYQEDILNLLREGKTRGSLAGQDNYAKGEFGNGKDFQTNQRTLTVHLHYRLVNKNFQETFDKNDSKTQGKKIGKTVCHLFYFVNGYLLDHNDLKIDELPIATVYEYKVPTSFYGLTTVELLVPQQKTVDLITNQMLANTLYLQNPIYVVSSSSGIDPVAFLKTKTENISSAFISNDESSTVSQSITMVDAPAIPETSIKLLQESKETLSILSGTEGAFKGQGGTTGSGSADQAMIERSEILDKGTVSEIEKYILRLSRIMFKLLTKNEKELSIRVDNENPNKGTTDEFINLKVEDIENLELEVLPQVNFNPQLTQHQIKRDTLDLSNLGAQMGVDILSPQEVVENFNLPNKSLILDRLNNQSKNAMKEKFAILVEMLKDNNVRDLINTPEGVGSLLDGILGEPNEKVDNVKQKLASGASAFQPNKLSSLRGNLKK